MSNISTVRGVGRTFEEVWL